MNRKKKLNDAYDKKIKKLNAKLRVTNKPKYIAKAERENAGTNERSLSIADASLVSETQL